MSSEFPVSSEYPALAPDKRPLPRAPDDDEISLIDLWIVLVRRKWVVGGVLLLCLLLGLAWALLKSPSYQYETTIQVGQVFSGDVLQPIEPVGSVLAKIQETYIPLARGRVLSGEATGGFKLEVRSPADSALIVVTGEGPPAQQATYHRLLQGVLEQLQNDLQPRFKAAQKAIERDRMGAEARLQQLEAEASLSQAQLKRLDGWTETLEQRLQDTRAELQELRRQREALFKRPASDSDEGQLIALNADVASLRETISDLQEQLGRRIPEQRDEITRELKQNVVEQNAQHAHIQGIEARAAALTPTRAVLEPQRLPEATGTSPVVIMALAGVLGLMLGVFAAFFTEFLARANAVMRASAER